MFDVNDEQKTIDLLAVGNPIVDILVKTDDEFLKSLGFQKGTMNIITKSVADKIFSLLEQLKKVDESNVSTVSGGCAANVAASISSFTGEAAFIGKLGKDDYGEMFLESLKERGVKTDRLIRAYGGETGRCLVVVTPDGSRTMCTYVGSSCDIDGSEISDELLSKTKVLFISGFLWDCNEGAGAVSKIIKSAKEHKCKIALSLADPLCVERYKTELLKVVENDVDIFFANQLEINTLLSSKSHAKSVKIMRNKYLRNDKIAVLTCSSDGAVIINKKGLTKVKGEKVDNIIDSTGSGAIFASGFIFGQLKGLDIEKSAKLANMAAAQSLKKLGARPIKPLSELLSKL